MTSDLTAFSHRRVWPPIVPKGAEPVRAAGDRVPAIQMASHRDLEPRTTAPTGLRRNLQDVVLQGDRVILRDHALVFVAEDRIEIDRPHRHKRTGGIPRGARERGVVLRHEVIGEIPIRRREGGDHRRSGWSSR